jgi:hypothetical protein
MLNDKLQMLNIQPKKEEPKPETVKCPNCGYRLEVEKALLWPSKVMWMAIGYLAGEKGPIPSVKNFSLEEAASYIIFKGNDGLVRAKNGETG